MRALSGELDYRIGYDVEHDLFHAQNVFNDEYIKPTFIEYVQNLEKENTELKADNDARKFAMAMSEKVEKQLREENAKLKVQIEKMKCCINDLVHLGEFNEHTDEEYFNYQVHEALKNAEQFISEVEK